MTAFNDDEVQALLDRIESIVTDSPQRETLLIGIGERVGTLAEGHARDGLYPERREGVPLELFYTRTTEAKKPYKQGSLTVGFAGEQFKSKFKSRRQQAYVMALVKRGKVPRTRTGFLGNSLTHIVSAVGTGVVIQVGTNLKYAKYPIGDEGEQNHYLATLGWERLGNKLSAHTAEYRTEIVEGLRGVVDYLEGGK